MDTLTVSGLAVETPDGRPIVGDISFSVAAGEIVALIGETGSGKSTIANAVLGYARAGARITAGSVMIDSQDILALDGAERRSMRGARVSYVPQDPSSALNPALRVRTQLGEAVTVHQGGLGRSERDRRITAALSSVHLPTDREFQRRFPHQLSGGQQQRVSLAMALMPQPRVVVFDEPTTGLDVTTQARVLESVVELCGAQDLAALYVTHDLGVVGELANRVLVLYAGRVVEAGDRDEIFGRPGHPYTAALIASSPDVQRPRQLAAIPGESRGAGGTWSSCEFGPRCSKRTEVCDLSPPTWRRVGPEHHSFCHHAGVQVGSLSIDTPWRPSPGASDIPGSALAVDRVSASYGVRQVLTDVSLTVNAGECVALVGESGSGKTTLSRVIAGLVRPDSGHVLLGGSIIAASARDRTPEERRAVGYVFQNPYGSLNPRKKVVDTVGAPARFFFGLDGKAMRKMAASALERVALPAQLLDKYPDELSGGERQRVAIARSLGCEPSVLICDEITSALDVSVQAAIIAVLAELQVEQQLGVLFVTHNLALVRSIATRVVVLRGGRVADAGLTDVVLSESAAHDYTRGLMLDTPSLVGATAAATDTLVKARP